MKKRTVIVMSLVVLGLLASRTFAQVEDSASLSAEDEQAYKEALASWKHSADMNKEIGLPPFGEEPERVDFSGFVAEQEANSKETTLIEAEKTAKWEKRLEEVRPFLRTLVKSGTAEPNDHRSTIARQEKEQLLRVADERWARRDEVERELDEIAARLGVERKWETGNGRYAILAGEIDGEPIWIGSHNQFAAASISADELWPANLTPWPSASTGLGLTGTNITLGMWEAEGYARESHHEFQGRVVQMDRTNGTSHFHATGVAGTMAAGGHLFYTNFYGFAIRGVAFEANVDAFDLWQFDSELADASAGDTNAPGLRLSNHSWGTVNAWSRYSFSYPEYDGGVTNWVHVTNGWIWNGFPSLYYSEESKFGMYLMGQPNGSGCAQLDGFLATNATQHLMVYSAGNDRFSGPGQPTNYYVLAGTNTHVFSNPSENERDWISGDDNIFGFDTMSPPGTAKNVLTVGSVRDVYHVIGSTAFLGYNTNSPVSMSVFSATGPTDDGRIKPDVMATGQSNASIRSFGIVTADSADDTNYQHRAGTSFAAPGVTAGLGLVLQRRAQLFPNLDADTDDYRGATMKATAIHTADDLWNPGPDYLTGWGLFNAVSAVRQIELDAADGRGTHIKEIELEVGQTNSWLLHLDGSSFKATAVWSDLPGIPSEYLLVDDPTPMLVNNIDVRVETEDGAQVFMPWVLDPDLTNKSVMVRASPATTGYDDRNNVEQVVISTPEPGIYRIVVTHSGGLPGGPAPADQWVSVLLSGNTPLSPKVTQVEHSPSMDECLIAFECDPGAYLHLETTTNLLDETSWESAGMLVTESWSNAVLPECDSRIRFWRLHRETGE
jgi:hypothetical protein